MKRSKSSLILTTSLALLSAISIIAGKYLAIPGGEVLRFSFENLPILFAGIAFGPISGALVGAVADLVGCVLVGYTINPAVTAGAVSIGLIGGACALLLKAARLPLSLRVAVSVSLAHIVGSVIIKTIGLAVFYSMPLGVLMLWRLLNYLIVGAVEGFILYALLKNKLIVGQVDSVRRAFLPKNKQRKTGSQDLGEYGKDSEK